jgi:hypothetical protein
LKDGGVAEEFLEHLRGDFDEVAFYREGACASPGLLASENIVNQVAELVEECDDVVVFHQAGIGRARSAT